MMLDRERILDLLGELDSELAEVGVRGDVFIVGGAAMTVAYRARPATRDRDAIWEPSTDIRAAAAKVAERHGDLDPDWLNDGVKGFLPGPDRGVARAVYEGDHLSVAAASPEYMLATKLFASRVARDEEDIRTLARMCGIATVDEGLELVERFYGTRPIEPKVTYRLEQILSDG